MGFFDWVLTIIGTLLMLTCLVVVHEWGHFSIAKKLKFKIDEFSVGFGPKIFQRVKNGIMYSIRWLPLGGYCKFFGEFGEDDEKAEEKKEKSPDIFTNNAIWKRFLVFLAGPVYNIIFGILITVIVLLSFGDYVPAVAKILPDSPAQEAGFQEGDKIISVDGRKIDFYDELVASGVMSGEENQTKDFVVERNGNEVALSATYRNMTTENQAGEQITRPMLGITYGPEAAQYGFFQSIGLSVKWFFVNLDVTLKSLSDAIFRGRGYENFTGIVGITDIMSKIDKTNVEVLLRLIALFSMGLGIANLLPIPALDGGRIVLLGIEKLRGRQFSMKTETAINMVGFGILIILFVLITVQDIGRLVGG